MNGHRGFIPPDDSREAAPRPPQHDRPGVERVTAAAADGTTAVGTKRRHGPPALAVLLSGQLLRDGEVVQLILKPSLWFVLFASTNFVTGMAILAIAASLWLPDHVAWYYVEAALFVAAGRLMWATLQWVNRLYVLTDQRVLRLSGVFTIEVFECPLRRVGQTRVLVGLRERFLRLGSVEIQPADQDKAAALWQTIRKPREMNELLSQAVAKAKNGGCGV